MDEILIVGAGPVGLAMATGLVQQGVSVKVIEAAPQFTTVPKASTIHPPTLEILEEWGLINQVKEAGLLVERFQYWDRPTREMIAEFNLNVLEGETEYPYRIQCEQHELTKIFSDFLMKSGKAEIHLASKLVDVQTTSEGVIAYVETPNGIKKWSCDFLIGADGASSAVRKKMNIPFEGLTYPQSHLLICVQDHDFSVHYPTLSSVSYFFDPKEWIALIQNRSFWKFLIPLNQNSDQDVDEEFIQQKLRDFSGTEDTFDVYHWVIYKVHQRVAKKFLDGRVALIGDAAHVNSPLGGMGMNSGIHDAYFLANDLARIVRGEADFNILEEFEKKRQNITKEFVQKHTIKNEEVASQKTNDNEQRENLRKMMSDNKLAKEYMLGTSMIESFNLMKS